MGARVVSRLVGIAFVACAGLAASGCDNGGLLVVEHTKPPPVNGPSVNDLVNGGTYAKNAKYRLFYTLGQPSPNQDVSKTELKTMHGGLAGAAHGD